MARNNVTAEYDDNNQVIWTFGGQGWVSPNNRLHCYDAYSNELRNLDANNKPRGRNHAGLSLDTKRNKILMYGGQYLSDELTHIYDVATNTWTSHNISPRPPSTKTYTYSSAPSMAYDSINDIHLCIIYRESQADPKYGSLETWAFDMKTMTWSEVAANEPAGLNMNGGGASVRGHNLSFSPEDNTFYLESVYKADTATSKNDENQIWSFRYADGTAYGARPKAPEIITGSDNITVSWGAVSGASLYRIFRATGTIPNLTAFTPVHETASLLLVDSAVTPGTIYYYRIAPVISGSEGRKSSFARSQPRVMNAPLVEAMPDYTVDISWDAHTDSDIAGYNLYRGVATIHTNTTIVAEDCSWTDNRGKETVYDDYSTPVIEMIRNVTTIRKLNTAGLITGTSYSDVNAALSLPNSEHHADYEYAVYAYIIKAVNKLGVESGPSPYRITIPSAPRNVLLSGNQIKWDAAAESTVIGWNVYKWDDYYQPVDKINTSLITSSPYILPELSYRGSDRFWVVPVDSLGQEGVPSVPVYYRDFYNGFHSGTWHQ